MTATPSLHLVERAVERLRQDHSPGPGPMPADALVAGASTAPEPIRATEAEGPPAPAGPLSAFQGTETITLRQLERGGMVSHMTDGNRVWEEFRIAQSQLMRNPPAATGTAYSGANLCLVTSALPGEGKSFCAINMAASLARYSARKIMLVDIDPKPKSLSRTLGIADDRFGVWDLAADPRADPARTVIATELPNLSFVPIGAYHEHETLSIAPAIQELGRQFWGHFVILDASPCLCSGTPSTLAALVGQIVFVVEAERTQRSEIEAALDLIEACPNVKLLLNKIQSSASSTFGTYRYGYRRAAENS